MKMSFHAIQTRLMFTPFCVLIISTSKSCYIVIKMIVWIWLLSLFVKAFIFIFFYCTQYSNSWITTKMLNNEDKYMSWVTRKRINLREIFIRVDYETKFDAMKIIRFECFPQINNSRSSNKIFMRCHFDLYSLLTTCYFTFECVFCRCLCVSVYDYTSK